MMDQDKLFNKIKKETVLIIITWFFVIILSFFAVWTHLGHVPTFTIAGGDSMIPTVTPGDILFIKSPLFSTGDIIVYNSEAEELKGLICKRVVATEGDTVTIDSSDIIVNNQKVGKSCDNAIETTFTLNKGEIFLLGDNPPASLDSRTLGVFNESNVIGKATVIRSIKDLICALRSK